MAVADLRDGPYRWRPPSGHAGWLLGLSAPWVEHDHLCHDLLALVPDRSGEWGRALTHVLARRGLGSVLAWRGEVRRARDAVTTTLERVATEVATATARGVGPAAAAAALPGPAPVAMAQAALVADGGAVDLDAARCWDVGATGHLLRLGAAAGYTDAGAAMAEVAEQADRLPLLRSWVDYGDALERAGRFLDPARPPSASSTASLLAPGMPWGDIAWLQHGSAPAADD